ncbi:MAG: hypothetical protein M3Y13_06580 [Armatimonadota bacterium]|nr:hypothetical protein [Armatimonadota bacterium]
MTLDLQAALPEELSQKIADMAAQRGLTAGDFLVLLLGLFTLPQMRLSEDPVVRDLSDELMLFCRRRAAGLERESGKTLDLLPDPFAAKPTPEQIAEEIKNWRTPQSLDELKPRVPPPPGMTAMQFIEGKWPGDETEEELLATLKSMG